MGNLSILRGALASAQVSSYTTGSITLPSAKGVFTLPPNSYNSISTVTTTGTVSSIQFTSIPATYKHLQLRFSAVGTTDHTIQINSALDPDSAHRINGNSSSAIANSTQINYLDYYLGFSATSPSIAILDFLDYANTNKTRVMRYIEGTDRNGTGEINLGNILWNTTAAITAIKISGNISANSSFALYGIKGA